MVCYDVFGTALAMIAENDADAASDKLKDRALRLINAGCMVYAELNRLLGGRPAVRPVTDLSEAFPLSGRLFVLICCHVAAGLTADENPDLAATLREAEQALADEARRSVSADLAPIRDVYGI